MLDPLFFLFNCFVACLPLETVLRLRDELVLRFFILGPLVVVLRCSDACSDGSGTVSIEGWPPTVLCWLLIFLSAAIDFYISSSSLSNVFRWATDASLMSSIVPIPRWWDDATLGSSSLLWW